MLCDILFYVYLLMVLPTPVWNYDKLSNWLWWYPPSLRHLRQFRIRNTVSFFL